MLHPPAVAKCTQCFLHALLCLRSYNTLEPRVLHMCCLCIHNE